MASRHNFWIFIPHISKFQPTPKLNFGAFVTQLFNNKRSNRFSEVSRQTFEHLSLHSSFDFSLIFRWFFIKWMNGKMIQCEIAQQAAICKQFLRFSPRFSLSSGLRQQMSSNDKSSVSTLTISSLCSFIIWWKSQAGVSSTREPDIKRIHQLLKSKREAKATIFEAAEKLVKIPIFQSFPQIFFQSKKGM